MLGYINRFKTFLINAILNKPIKFSVITALIFTLLTPIIQYGCGWSCGYGLSPFYFPFFIINIFGLFFISSQGFSYEDIISVITLTILLVKFAASYFVTFWITGKIKNNGRGFTTLILALFLLLSMFVIGQVYIFSNYFEDGINTNANVKHFTGLSKEYKRVTQLGSLEKIVAYIRSRNDFREDLYTYTSMKKDLQKYEYERPKEMSKYSYYFIMKVPVVDREGIDLYFQDKHPNNKYYNDEKIETNNILASLKDTENEYYECLYYHPGTYDEFFTFKLCFKERTLLYAEPSAHDLTRTYTTPKSIKAYFSNEPYIVMKERHDRTYLRSSITGYLLYLFYSLTL